MKKKSANMFVLFILLLPTFWLLVMYTNNKPPAPYHEKNLETLKEAQRDDLVTCTVPKPGQLEKSIKRAVLVHNNTGKGLYGYELNQFSLGAHNHHIIPYSIFEDCEVKLHKDKAVIRRLVGTIIIDGLAR